MSIIYDALKKVEKINPAGKPNELPRAPNYKNYLVYILIAGLGIVIANLFFGFFSKPLPPKVNLAPNGRLADTLTAPPAAAPQVNPSQTPTENQVSPVTQSKKEPPHIVLNGVFFSENEGYALINNQIVKQGDSIEGAAVTRIGLNEVELTSPEGSLIKLSTSGN